MEQMRELLPCPFCGCKVKPAPHFEDTAVVADPSHSTDCPLVDLKGHRQFWPVEGWNRRATLPIDEGLREALEKVTSRWMKTLSIQRQELDDLCKYLRHHDTCLKAMTWKNTGFDDTAPCDCGLDSALAEAQKQGETT